MNNRWLTVVLAISVGLNLLLVGILIGNFAGRPAARPFPPHLGWILRKLEPETRQKLHLELEELVKNDRRLRRNLRGVQRSVGELITADPLDRSALETQLAELRESSSESQQALHQAMVEIMTKLNQEERRKILKSLRHNWRREFRRPNDRSGPPHLEQGPDH